MKHARKANARRPALIRVKEDKPSGDLAVPSSKAEGNGSPHAENGDVHANGHEEASGNGAPRVETRRRRATAESMAASQRDISVSEFFAKNRHLLGFDNPRKALLTTIKEAVDNSLDACEEAGILPEV